MSVFRIKTRSVVSLVQFLLKMKLFHCHFKKITEADLKKILGFDFWNQPPKILLIQLNQMIIV